jgi:hypothetical protein
MTQITASPQPEQNGSAREHRTKLFGWISIENIVQTAVFLAGGLVIFVKLQDSVEVLKSGQTDNTTQMRQVQADLSSHSTALQLQGQAAIEQARQTAILFQNEKESRQALDAVSSKVDVLLDRSKPQPK